MPDAICKTLAVVVGSISVLSANTAKAATSAPSLAALNANTPHSSRVTKVGHRVWHGPGWGPAPSLGWRRGPVCGAGPGWQYSSGIPDGKLLTGGGVDRLGDHAEALSNPFMRNIAA